MIPLIGTMVGAYIVTRCLEMGDANRKLVHVFAILTLVWTVLCIAALAATGFTASLPEGR